MKIVSFFPYKKRKVFQFFLQSAESVEIFFDKMQKPSGIVYLCTKFLVFFLICVQKLIKFHNKYIISQR